LFKGLSSRAIGAKHIEENIPCQDYAGHYCDEKFGVAVVSDGHGNKKHFRSDKGSEIAVKVSIEAIKEFIGRESEYIHSLFDEPDKRLSQLESNIVYRWNNMVMSHLNENPIAEEELLLYGNNAAEKSTTIYGATLIIAAITEKYWFALQTGDGSCVTVFDKENAKIFVPDDDRLAFNFTTSLCDSDAAGNFRHYFSRINEEKPMPLGIIVSTDGVSNSFEEVSFLSFNNKVLELLRTRDDALREIETFLPELSEKGSRDDVSIAAVYVELNSDKE